MNHIKYAYPRTDVSIRISSDLHKLVRHMAVDLSTTIQDVATFAILNTCDPGKSCEDWKALPESLK